MSRGRAGIKLFGKDGLLSPDKNILIFGAGGGGDVVSAAFLALKLREFGVNTYISAFPWERYVVDPIPGPISIDEVHMASELGEYSLAVSKSSYAYRGGRKIVFQAVNVSRALGEEVYLSFIDRGVEGLYNGLIEIIDRLKIDLLIGLDVGGDILALGGEKELWSPLADQMSLAALYKVDSNNICSSMVAVAFPGADGELNRDYIMRRISGLAADGGLVGAIGFSNKDIHHIERILGYAVSEAGTAVRDALYGKYGWKTIRKGTRRVFIDPLSTIVFFLDIETVYNQSPMARRLLKTNSFEQANKVLNDLGIYTEYDLELDLYIQMKNNVGIDTELIRELKDKGRLRIRSRRQG